MTAVELDAVYAGGKWIRPGDRVTCPRCGLTRRGNRGKGRSGRTTDLCRACLYPGDIPPTEADALTGGQWVIKPGGVKVWTPHPAAPPAIPPCIGCGQPSLTIRCKTCHNIDRATGDHRPSHAGFNKHKKRGETPCDECREAERLYQHARHLRRKLAQKRAA